MSRRKVAGKRVLLTGGSSGIGRELALQLARRGASLVVTARREELLRELQSVVQADARREGRNAPAPDDAPAAAGHVNAGHDASPSPVHIVAGDLTQPSTRQSLVEAVQERLGRLDILINNAGVTAHGRFEEASPERLRQVFEVNFFAAVELTRAALPLLKQGHAPLVVNVGSILGRRGIPFNSEYCASKFALAGWSEAVRPELARHGIDVLLVSPGSTDTEFFAHALESTGVPRWQQRKGTRPSATARAIIKGIERGRREVVVGMASRAFVLLDRWMPGLVDRYLRQRG